VVIQRRTKDDWRKKAYKLTCCVRRRGKCRGPAKKRRVGGTKKKRGARLGAEGRRQATEGPGPVQHGGDESRYPLERGGEGEEASGRDRRAS